MIDQISHIEIAGQNGDELKAFYTKLFGWSFDVQDNGGFKYGWFSPQFAEKTTGGLRYEPEGKAEIVIYVTIDDLDAKVRQAEELGAAVRIPPMDGGGTYFALITDPEGNPIGMVQRLDSAKSE